MPPLPKLLVSSVVRGANQGDSHGGIYLVDFERKEFEQLVDWNSGDINFEGRGADRGLRGIVIHDELIYVAASDELFAFDRKFNIVASYRNPYLKHCHEICTHRGSLYLTSTGFDSILRFDLAAHTFNFGVQLLRQPGGLGARIFNPLAPGGPPAGVEFHLNNVHVSEHGIFASGRHLPALAHISPKAISIVAQLPLGTHNARPFEGGVLYNDTEQDTLNWLTPARRVSIPVPRYPDGELLCVNADTSGLARQAFGRGLCPVSARMVAAGSSPTTVSLYDLQSEQRLTSINLTMDIRNAAHGMVIWPY